MNAAPFFVHIKMATRAAATLPSGLLVAASFSGGMKGVKHIWQMAVETELEAADLSILKGRALEPSLTAMAPA